MLKIAIFCLFITTSAISFAQKSIITGRVYDSTRHERLAFSTISLIKATDSTLVGFTRADSLGTFALNVIESGKYLISASYVGFVPVWKLIEVRHSGIQHIGDLNLHDIKSASNIMVNVARAPVVMNNDTLELNAENFKTQPNAVVEDMLKKMPGFTIDKNGTVKVNGQIIKRVLVNGKEFFTGDVKMATRNLPADAVDKVQVYDKQSDQSRFTGIDDGNTEKTINLKLKKERNNAIFGKVMGGAGSDKRFDAQANINRFKGNEQLSFLGMSNNTNRQGFQLTDVLNFTGALSKAMRNGGGVIMKMNTDDDNGGLPITGLGQTQQGIATTTAGGVNYNNLFNKEKTDLSSNFMASNIHLVTNKESNSQNVLPGNTFNRFQVTKTIDNNTQQRHNLIIEQKIDSSFSFKIMPSVTWQQTNKKCAGTYTELKENRTKLNDGLSNTTFNTHAFNFNNNILFRKKFVKKGRTISLNISMSYNHSDMNGTLVSDNKFYKDDGRSIDSSLNQIFNRKALTKNLGSTIIYTEPLGSKSLFEFNGFLNTTTSTSGRQTYDYNYLSGHYDVLNGLLSNDYKSKYTFRGGGINFRTNQKKVKITAGAQLQASELTNLNKSVYQAIGQHVIDVLPNAIVQYNISKMKNLRFEYHATTTEPSITQLQPVADVSDPLNIIIGNPNLKRTYEHEIQVNLFTANPEKRKNLFGFFYFTTTANAIVKSDTIKQNGTRISSYINTNGIYNIFGNLEYGFPLNKLKSRIEIANSVSYSKNTSFINAQRNNIYAFSVGPKVNYHFGIDNKINLDISVKITVNQTKYSLQPFIKNNYLEQNYGIDMINNLPWNISIRNEFNYILNSGVATGFNTKIPLWNASLAKGFLKNKRVEFKFSIQDLLNENIGTTRNSSQGYIVDERYNVLKRYFLLSLTYSLNKSGLNSSSPRAMVKTF